MNKFIKFKDFAHFYFKSLELRIDKTTMAGYNSILKEHLVPCFGNMRLLSIKTETIQEFVFDLYNSGLSSKTIKNIFSLLRSILSKAVRMGIIKKNPCLCVDLPAQCHVESDCYTLDEVYQLLDALNNLPEHELKFKVAIELALLCGWRKSEICGLDWDCVDLVNRTARVKKKRVLVTGIGLVEGKPKTPNSNRTSVLPDMLFNDMLELYNNRNSVAVISSAAGSPIYPQVLARWFKRFLVKNGLREISLHKLRHTYASMLSSMNVNSKRLI